MREGARTACWLVLMACVVGWFFHETIFQGRSLVPTDALNQLILPYGASVKRIEVQNHYPIDIVTQDYPWGLFWRESVSSCEIPLWNPYIMGGHPHLAASMEAGLNPFKILCLFLPVERAFSIGIVLQFLLAGVFMFAFLREMGRSRCAAFVGGCAFLLSSSFVMWYWRMPSTFLWAPLILLFFERAQRKNSWGEALASGFVMGVAFVSGSIQAAFHLAFLCAGYFTLIIFGREFPHRGRAVRHMSVIFLIAVLASAIQWLPTAELLAQGGSGRLENVTAVKPGLQHTLLGLPMLITFIFPALAGSPATYDLMKLAGATLAGFTGYIGIVPFTLALIGVLLSRDKRIRALLLVAAAVIVIVFFTPLARYVYHRFFVVIVFSLAVMSAYGTDKALEFSETESRKIRCVFTGMVALCLAVALGLLAVQWYVHLRWDSVVEAGQRFVMARAAQSAFGNQTGWLLERVPRFLNHFRLSNIMFWLPLVSIPIVAVAWDMCARKKLGRAALCVLVVGLAICDLTFMGRHWVPQVNTEVYPLYPSLEIFSPMKSDHSQFRMHQWSPRQTWILPNNILMVYGFSALGGYESLSPETISSLPNRDEHGFNKLLNLQNVKYLLTDASVSLPSQRFELLTESGGVRLYRNNDCLPRFQFFDRWEVLSDRKEMLKFMTSDEFEPANAVLLEKNPPIAARDEPEISASAQIVVKKYTPQHIVVTVNAAQSGILLLADTYYPGWRAQIDGQPTPIYRANYIMRAVAVPNGEHEIEMFYAPLSFRIGAATSGLTILACLAARIGLSLRKKRA
jgi:hypothetical protein